MMKTKNSTSFIHILKNIFTYDHPPQRLKKIAYFRSPSRGVNYHRLSAPLSLLTKEGYSVTEVDIIPIDQCDYDTIIINRATINFYPMSVVRKLQKKGVRLVYDLDDYWTRPKYSTHHIPQYESEFTVEILNYLKIADIVWVSTPYLLELVRGITPNAILVPNALDYTEPMWTRLDIERPLTYGWVGGTNHHIDFGTVRGWIDGGIKAKPVICGAGQEDRYWNYLLYVMSGGKPDKGVIYGSVDVEAYGALYNELDIVVLPSYDDKFCLCKSNLKLLEAGAHKLPVISNGGTYKEVNGKIGLRVNSPREMNKALKRLIESKRMRVELGDALHEYTTEKYNINKINQIRKQTL